MKPFQLLEIVREAALTLVHVIDEYHLLRQENKELKAELKQYKDLIYQASNRPHPAEAILKLMSEDCLTLHTPKKHERA